MNIQINQTEMKFKKKNLYTHRHLVHEKGCSLGPWRKMGQSFGKRLNWVDTLFKLYTRINFTLIKDLNVKTQKK